MIRVAFLTTLTKEHLDLGMGVRTFKFAVYLHKLTKFQIDLWNTIPLPKQECEYLHDRARKHGIGFYCTSVQSYINTEKIFSTLGVFPRLLSIPHTTATFLKELKEYDYVWIFQPVPQHSSLPFIKMLYNVKNNSFPILILDWPMDYSNIGPNVVTFLYRYLLANSVKAITVPNKELVDQVRTYARITSNNIYILPHGIDTSVFKPLPNHYAKTRIGIDDKFVILRMGSYSRMPIKPLIPLIKKLSHTIKNILLLSIGGTLSQVEEARRLVRVYDTHDLIRVEGIIPEEELQYYIASSDVCLFYDIMTKRKDFPTKILYFMAMKKPIVALKTDGIKETLKGISILVPTINEFYEAIMRIYRNPDEVREISEKAYLEARKYDWNNVVKKFLFILSNVRMRVKHYENI